jgi:hypothetical protein
MADPSTAPTGSSEFDQPWTNPLDSMGSPPKLDYGKALEAKKDITQKELGAVSGVIAKTDAEEKKYEGIADKKFQQLESFDPNQVKPWDAKEEQKKYQDDPYSAFGSFAMVASLGLAAFTKTPFTNSMNAMAGVINGRREAKDQEYERSYKAWQDNTKLFFDRFNMVKSQVGDAVEMMKTKGELGKSQLANTLTKYGLAQDLALLNAGYDDVLAQKWVAQAKAVGEMADAREKIETDHSVREAMRVEDEQRKALGLAPMSPQEKLEMKGFLTEKHTPEQAAFQDAWHTFMREHPDATSEEKSDFMQRARSYGKLAQTKEIEDAIVDFKSVVPDLTPTEQAVIKTALGSKGAKAPEAVAKMTGAMDAIRKAAESGQPMDPAQRAELLRNAAGSGGSGATPEGRDFAAETYLQSGTLPSRNRESNEQIISRAAQMAKERGIDVSTLPKKWQEFKAEQVGMQRYFSGTQGQQTVAINTVVDHLKTMREVEEALKNGDITVLNRIGQMFAKETGQPEPTNAMLTGQLVGTELVRAMGVAGAGTKEERDELGAILGNVSSSPEQIEGAAATAEKLLAGKLFSLRLAFPGATGLDESKYDSMLSNRTKSVLFPLIRSDKPQDIKESSPEVRVPPISILKEGFVTTLTDKNTGKDSSWIIKDGKAVQVK